MVPPGQEAAGLVRSSFGPHHSGKAHADGSPGAGLRGHISRACPQFGRPGEHYFSLLICGNNSRAGIACLL